MHYHICIVEDDKNIQRIVSAYLEKEGYTLSIVDSGEDAWELWRTDPPDMWVLDIMLPGMDGYELCKKIRKESDVPIIIISAKDEELDKILGLELGGDDYLTKPFSPRELLARIKRIFKRSEHMYQPRETPSEKVELGDLAIDKSDRRVFWEGQEVEITTKEFDLLIMLAEHYNRAYSREQLLTHVWGEDYFGSDRAVDDLIKRVRKKLEGIPIETVWGYGYRLRYDGDGS